MDNIILAAGGLVSNSNNEYLLIYRLGKWDLPKGKLDHNEAIEACAIREVEEETGLQNIILKDLIITTTHSYLYNETPYQKKTYWYNMQITNNQVLIPQTSEAIEQAIWVSKANLNTYLDNTYPNIRAIFLHLNLIS
jgi:8-oxo-dGTP pyrophosphatase MutT (NUDIX family)